MAAWTNAELEKIGRAEELDIQSMRQDGTLRKPVTIWVVRVGDELYVRPVNGREAAWFRGVQTRHEGHVRAGGVDKDVTFVEADGNRGLNGQIDEAYRAKYRKYSSGIVGSVLTSKSRAATIQIVPR